MLPEMESHIASVVTTDEVVRLVNGMLAHRVNAARLTDDACAVDAVRSLADAFVEHVRMYDPGAEPCFVLGGGAKLRTFFDGPFHGVSKDGATGAEIGGRVYLIEDVLTTGGSAMRAVKALREKGIGVEFLFALVDRGIGAVKRLRQAGVSVTTATEVRAYDERRFGYR